MSRSRRAETDAHDGEGAPDGALGELDRVFAAARPKLVGLAASLVGLDGAEDAVHDTYLAARSAWGDLRDRSAAEAWLRRICIHRCFRDHRRRRLLERVLPMLASGGRSVTRAGTGTTPGPDLDLRELVERLPARHRTVVVLQYGHGYALDEIAELVGISHDNARAIASRARRRLLTAWLEAER